MGHESCNIIHLLKEKDVVNIKNRVKVIGVYSHITSLFD